MTFGGRRIELSVDLVAHDCDLPYKHLAEMGIDPTASYASGPNGH